MVEDPALQLAELRARLEPELVAQLQAKRRERFERVRLPPGAVQGLQQLALQPLPQRMHRHEVAQLRQQLRMPAELQQHLDPLLSSQQPQLLQPLGLRSGEVLVAELSVRSPAPERLGAVEQRQGERGIPFLRALAALAEQPLEARRIESLAIDLQGIAGLHGPNPDSVGKRPP